MCFRFKLSIHPQPSECSDLHHTSARKIKEQRHQERCSLPAYDRLIAGIQVLEIPAAGSLIQMSHPRKRGPWECHKRQREPELRISVTLHSALAAEMSAVTPVTA